MCKIIIIGGGIAGLSAGIYAQKSGFNTIIYEKNAVPGGNCSGWNRNGYHIDNCIHWLTGTKSGTAQNRIWNELGVLGEGIELIKRDSFYTSEWEGQHLTLWRDVERTRQDMLTLSPADALEINRFIDYVRLVATILSPEKESRDLFQTISEMDFVTTHFQMAKAVIYIGMSLEELSQRFQHPLLRQTFLDFMAKEYEAYWLVLAYSFFISDNGDIPAGGSMGIVQHMVDLYQSLGGHIEFNTPVEQILINKRKFPDEASIKKATIKNTKKVKKLFYRNAESVLLYNGKTVPADYIICACDINYTFQKLLRKKRYIPSSIKKVYSDKKCYPIYSSFQVAFAVDGLLEEINDTLSFTCHPIDVGHRIIDRICVKNYRIYGDYIAPEGKTVIQCSIIQYEKDFKFWKKLYHKKEQYLRTKQNIAEAIKTRIETRFPEYEGKLHLLDVWTPASYAIRNNDYMGAYMRFITTATSPNAFLSCEVRGLRNVFLANHWLRYPGGVPTAATMGKQAIKEISELIH